MKIGFACFDLTEDLHLTICRRYDATDQELIEMKKYVEEKIKPAMPFVIRFGNFCRMGENGTFPAYKVYFDGHQGEIVKQFYETFYKDATGKALYPIPKFHITVDTPEKRATLENMIRETLQAPLKRFLLKNVSFKTRIEGGISQVADGMWTCLVCDCNNPLNQKECSTDGCDQWRPRDVAPEEEEQQPYEKQQPYPQYREGDWYCCSVNNFAQRTRCMKCAKLRPNLVARDAPALEPTVPKPVFYVDWKCPICDFKIFGSKAKCFKCGSSRPE